MEDIFHELSMNNYQVQGHRLPQLLVYVRTRILALTAARAGHQVVEGGGVAVHVSCLDLFGQGGNVEYLRLPLGAGAVENGGLRPQFGLPQPLDGRTEVWTGESQ